MVEDRCSFEVSKLAKEKGFDEYCSYSFDINGNTSSFSGYSVMMKYNKNSNIHLVDTNTEEFEYPDLICTIPSHSLLKKWLYVNYHLDVYVASNSLTTHFPMIQLVTIDGTNMKGIKPFEIYKTQYEAMEKGLLETLKYI